MLLFVMCFALPAGAQQIGEAEIERFIKCGMGEVKCDRPILTPGGFSLSMLDIEVQVLPPLGVVYLAARDAKEKYKKFSRAEVTDEMLAPVITVRVRHTGSDMKTNVNIEHLVILPRRSKEGAVQPTKIEDWNFEAKNLMGAAFTRIGKSAQFNIADLPPGELDIVIVSDRYGKERAAIDKKDRDKLNSWTGRVSK